MNGPPGGFPASLGSFCWETGDPWPDCPGCGHPVTQAVVPVPIDGGRTYKIQRSCAWCEDPRTVALKARLAEAERGRNPGFDPPPLEGPAAKA